MKSEPTQASALLSRPSLRAFLYAWRRSIGAGIVAFFVLFLVSYAAWFRAPAAFPTGSIVTVAPGSSLGSVAKLFATQGIIRSPFWFEVLVRLGGGQRRIAAGDYFLPAPQSAFTIAQRIMTGASGVTTVRVTIREGLTNQEIASLLTAALPSFETLTFLQKAEGKEGYLFPDTYFFPVNESAEAALARLTMAFDARTASLQTAGPAAVGHPFSDILVVASLIEKEAKTPEDRRIIAGILWKRLSIRMPLQVDAAFTYINGGKEPSAKDTKIDSPYNTYTHLGLPPTPIDNPGLEAIKAAIEPVETSYLYYLSDKEGSIHYAVTYAEQQANEKRYLK